MNFVRGLNCIRRLPREMDESATTVEDKLTLFFEKYREPDSDAILAPGIEAMCTDLNISLLDPITLVIAYHCRAESMGTFSKEEFIRGMADLSCMDIAQLKRKIPELRAELGDAAACKKIYVFTFGFTLDQGQRQLPIDVSIELWKILLSDKFFFVDEWIAFAEASGCRAISRDIWMMLYDLATEVKPDLSNYEDDCSWPVLLDDFVASVRTKQNICITLHQLHS